MLRSPAAPSDRVQHRLQLPAHPCTFDYSIRELVLDVVSATEALAAEKKLGLEIDVPRDLPRGRGDERRLIQVLKTWSATPSNSPKLGP